MPRAVKECLRDLCARVGQAQETALIDFAEARPNDCFENARKHVDKFGGEVVLGWLVSQGLALALCPHAVVRTKNGLIADVTLGNSNSALLFLPSISPEEFEILQKQNAGWFFPEVILAYG